MKTPSGSHGPARVLVPVLFFVAAAVCGAQGTAPLQLRLFPRLSVLTVDGAPVPPAPDGGLPNALSLTPGNHALSLSSYGYITREFAASAPPMTEIEGKLERRRTGLVKIGEMVTGTWPKCAEYTPDGRFIICALLRAGARTSSTR